MDEFDDVDDVVERIGELKRQLSEVREALRHFVNGWNDGSLVENEHRTEAYWNGVAERAAALLVIEAHR